MRQSRISYFPVRWFLTLLLCFGACCFSLSFLLPSGVNAQSSCQPSIHTVTLNQGHLSYSEIGTGKPIVLLHGLFASKEQWTEMMCQLANAGYQALAIDLPGYGESQGFSLRDYALDNQYKILHQWTNQLGITSFDIAGSSMGGAIAYLYAQEYPEQVKSLAFIGAPSGSIDWASPVREAFLQGINPFIPLTLEQLDLELSLLFLHPPTLAVSIKRDKVKEYSSNNQHYQQVWNIFNLYGNVLRQPWHQEIPTLILWGEADQIFDVSGASPLQARIAGSQLHILPEAGHLLMMENSREVTSKYINFLQELGCRNC